MQKLWIDKIESDYNKWADLLKESGLKTENTVHETYGIFENDVLVATGSTFENIIKCIAIKESYQGGSVFNELISFLISTIYEKGFKDIYVYTKPISEKAFSFLGFKTIERVGNDLVFMENSTSGFDKYINSLVAPEIQGTVGSIVMNANPFTNGHLYLVEQAKKICDILHIFVVSENKSVFDFNTRLNLIKEGTNHLNNVFYHSTSNYLVSSQTFPSYFLKESVSVTEVQAELDSRIFKYHIAPKLNIGYRFVGEEPFSKPTEIYNETMKKVFSYSPNPNYPLLDIIKRSEVDEKPISASTVRNLIANGEFDKVEKLVPKTTYDFLKSEKANHIIEKLKNDPLKGFKQSDTK